MGKLIISTHITVDGVMGPDPGPWAILEGSSERLKFDQLLAADAFLLGRKVYEGLAAYWPTVTDATGFAERTNQLPKYVASRTLTGPLGWNASLITKRTDQPRSEPASDVKPSRRLPAVGPGSQANAHGPAPSGSGAVAPMARGSDRLGR
jgi:hypothetical protein